MRPLQQRIGLSFGILISATLLGVARSFQEVSGRILLKIAIGGNSIWNIHMGPRFLSLFVSGPV